MPFIRGLFAETAKGTQITVKMGLHPVIIGLFSLIGIIAGVGAVMSWPNVKESLPAAAVFAVIYCFGLLSFKLEVQKAKRILLDTIARAEDRKADAFSSD